MKYISSVLVSICASCVFIGAIQMLCPKGNMEKSVKFILSLVFLVLIISCAGITVPKEQFKLDIASSSVSAEEMEIKSAEYVYAAALREKGINFRKITVCTDKTPSGSIVISKVCIYTDADKQTVIQSLGEAAKNFQVEVVNE